MNIQEVIALRKYAEGAYPQMKSTDTIDAVWLDMLQPYQPLGMMMALKSYIKTGNPYPPGVGELIKGYEKIVSGLDSDIIEKMDKEGIFDDPKETDREIAEWNRANRKSRATAWLSLWNREKVIPSWFWEIYDQYRQRVEYKYFGKAPGRKQIGE